MEFEPVTTTALRATFRGRKERPYFHSVSVSVWEVYAVPADKLPSIRVATPVGQAPALPKALHLPFRKVGALPVSIYWRSMRRKRYAKRGSFQVEGRVAGQAAGYVTPTLAVK